MASGDEERLERLFGDFLEASEQGRDIADELLAGAGELRPALAAKIELERELRGLSRAMGTSTRSADARRQLGRFAILRTLGQGGISRVYEAFDPRLGRHIALKVLDRVRLLDKDQEAWILNEARCLARISHPGVVQVYEIGQADGHTYVAMELLSGPTLDATLAELARRRAGRPGPEPTPELAAAALRLESLPARTRLLAELAEALAHCHDHTLLHRDVKPHNVVFHGATAKWIDFGLGHVDGADPDSKLGLTTHLVGTAGYSAPEQVANEESGADPRSDQFSFGVLAYEVLALENPFLRKSQANTLAAIEAADPPRLGKLVPAVARDVALVVHHALEREPTRRYPHMAALAADLRAVLAHRPITVQEPSLAHVASLWLRRHRRGVSVAAAVLGLALLAWVSLWIAGTLQARAAILDDLGRIQPAQFQGPAEFDASFQPLLDLQNRARAFDERFVRTALFGSLAPAAAAVTRAWSSALAASHEHELARSALAGVPVQNGIYRQLFWQESLLCPDCPDNLENRRRGHVALVLDAWPGCESALEIYALVGTPRGQEPLHAFRPTTRSELLVPGTYRIQVWEPGSPRLAAEAVFFVPEGWSTELRIEPNAPRAELLARTRPVPRGIHVLSDGERVLVPAFRILDHLVTRAELEFFLRESGLQLKLGDAPQDAPVGVPFDMALAYAAWAGGHLPSRPELMRADQAGVQRLPAWTEESGGELVLDLDPVNGNPTFLAFDGPTLIRPANRAAATRMGRDAALTSPVGFRVLFAEDAPRLYRDLAQDPLEPRAK